jgi:hypothetical protein
VVLFLCKAKTNMTSIHELETHKAGIVPEIADALTGLGRDGVDAYASVELRHRTLSTFVDSIVANGLTPNDNGATPDPEDVKFASELYETKGFMDPNLRDFFRSFIEGRKGDEDPGVYLYGLAEGEDDPDVVGYGVPERTRIFAQEMGYVILHEGGQFSEDERIKARQIFDKYTKRLSIDPTAYIAVFRANPFSPSVFNTRLANLPHAVKVQSHESIVQALKYLDLRSGPGIFVPGSIPPEDLELLDAKISLENQGFNLDLATLNPQLSRFIRSRSQ